MSPSPPSPHRHAALAILVLVATSLLASLTPDDALAAGTWTWPVEGEVLTDYRNGDDPYAAGQHRGIDIAASAGTAVRSATAGTVTFAGTAGSSGLTVSVRTADGRFDTSYLHLDSLEVGEGDGVEPGSALGTVGVTGRRSAEAPHVHFGVRDAGERHAYRDPLLFLAPPGTPVPGPPPAPVAAPAQPAPRPEPAPRPAPLPSSAPRPSPVADPSRAPLPLPSPKGAPGPAAAPSPKSSPRPLPGGAPRRGVRPRTGTVAGPEPRSTPAPQPRSIPARAPSSEPAPRPVPGPGALTAPEPGRGPASLGPAPEATRREPAGAPAGGSVLGWAAAFAGLVIASATLVRSQRARPRPAERAARSRRPAHGVPATPVSERA